MQTAGGFVSLVAELTAGVQGGHDDFEGRLARIFWVVVDRNAASVVTDDDPVLGGQLDFDPVGMPGDGFVHGIVENLAYKVVHGTVVGTADIHAGALPDGLKPLQHLDMGGVIIT